MPRLYIQSPAGFTVDGTYAVKGIARNMVKLLKQSSISLHFEKHKESQRVDYKGLCEREPGRRRDEAKISSLTERKRNIFLKTEDNRTYMASRWMTVWRLDTGELKRFRKDAVKMRWKATVQLGGDITKKAKKYKSRR